MKSMKLAAGIMIGMAAGVAVGAAIAEKKKSCRSIAARMINGLGDMVERIADAVGM